MKWNNTIMIKKPTPPPIRYIKEGRKNKCKICKKKTISYVIYNKTKICEECYKWLIYDIDGDKE